MSRHSNLAGTVVPPQSPFYQGLFGRLFPELEPWQPNFGGKTEDEYLHDVAALMVGDDGQPLDSQIPAGYTYFGQFIDHDITFDPTSSLARQNDPDKLHNFRTPRLDLDCVYSHGPAASPHLFESGAGRFIIGAGDNPKEPDLPRHQNGTALIGDPRNDENVIVSQLQLAMLKLHNRLYDVLEPDHAPDEAFREARRILTWLYQYVAWNDFVKRIIDGQVWANVLQLEETAIGVKRWNSHAQFYHWRNTPFMPVEFSVAAYRFGHSLVRSAYQLNIVKGFGVEVPVFDLANDPDGSLKLDLRGGRPLPASHTIQWDWFLDINSGGPFPQRTRAIDPLLSEALAAIPAGPGGNNALAFLNMKRGLRMQLPTGPMVSQYMGIDPIPVTEDHENALWFYLLKEATGEKLGKVGSVIVGEVFAGLLWGDPNSYLNRRPTWVPSDEPVLSGMPDDGQGPFPLDVDWNLRDIVRLARMPINNDDASTLING